MNTNGNRELRMKDPKDLLNDELLMQIPSDPQKTEIIEILSKNPSVMSYIQNILNELRNSIDMKKLLLKKAEREYEERLSKTRLNAITNYKNKIVEHLKNEPKEIDKLCVDLGVNRSEAKEIVKSQRPDKPTATDLKDVSIVRCKPFYDNEVVPLQQEIIELEKNYDEWKVKYNLFENNFKASQTIKGLLQNELKY